MNTLFSDLKKSDLIYEDDSCFSPTASAHPFSNSEQSYFASKRAMLREVNRTYRQQMWDMDAAFRETTEKWNNSGLATTQLYSTQINQPDSPFHGTGRVDRGFINIEDRHPYFSSSHVEDQEGQDEEKSPHETVIKEQHRLRDQLQAISKLLGSRIASSLIILQKTERRSPIKWNLLVKGHKAHPVRQLFKTNTNQQSRGHRYNYIAYTEQPSVNKSLHKNKSRKGIKNMEAQEKLATKSNKQVKKISSQGKVYQVIQARIVNSSATISKGNHATEINKTNHLFHRLAQEKNQRDNLLKSIKMQFK